MIVADHALYHGRKLPTISTFLRIAWDDADDCDYGDVGNAKLESSTISVSKPSAFSCTLHFLHEFFKIFSHVFEISSHPSSTAKINLTAYLLIGYTPQQEI